MHRRSVLVNVWIGVRTTQTGDGGPPPGRQAGGSKFNGCREGAGHHCPSGLTTRIEQRRPEALQVRVVVHSPWADGCATPPGSLVEAATQLPLTQHTSDAFRCACLPRPQRYQAEKVGIKRVAAEADTGKGSENRCPSGLRARMEHGLSESCQVPTMQQHTVSPRRVSGGGNIPNGGGGGGAQAAL